MADTSVKSASKKIGNTGISRNNSSISSKKDYDPNKRITIFQRDPSSNIYGVVSISKQCVLDVQYDGIRHELAVTLKSYAFRGHTNVQMVQKQKVVNGKVEKVPNTYTEHPIYAEEG